MNEDIEFEKMEYPHRFKDLWTIVYSIHGELKSDTVFCDLGALDALGAFSELIFLKVSDDAEFVSATVKEVRRSEL